MTTIDEAKKYLRANFDKGTKCPCCGQLVKKYNRHFNAGMAYSLILLYRINRLNPGEWIHVQDKFAEMNILATAIDYSQLKRWALLERKKAMRDDGAPSTGLWRITQAGIDFVERRTTVKDTAVIYDNRTLELTGNDIDIEQALKKKFNYLELMHN